MFADVLGLSFLFAWIRGGRPADGLRLRRFWLAPVALGMQLLALILPAAHHPPLMLSSYGVLLYTLFLNLDRQGVRLLFVGLVLNVLAMGLNGGRMPVHLPAAQRLGGDLTALVSGTDYKRMAMGPHTRFNFLGDVIYVPLPIPRVMSIGDLLIAAGAFLLIQDFMARPISFQPFNLSL